MCMFCAAIPMSASVGIALAGKQKKRLRQAGPSTTKPPRAEVPIARITVAVTGGLVVCAVVYHLAIMPRVGAVI